MYWFARPPWIRWVASSLLVLAGFSVELRSPPLTQHWFARDAIAAGTELTAELFELKPVIPGSYPTLEPDGYARLPIPAGDPLATGIVAPAATVAPQGWWSLELGVPSTLTIGQNVLLVINNGDESPRSVTGLAVSVKATDDPFGGATSVGTIAVPPGDAAVVATAVAAGRVSVLTGNR